MLLGLLLPLFLGVRREIASRAAYIVEERLCTRPLQVGDVVMQLGIICAHVMATLAVLTYIFTLMPEIDHFPTLLRTGQIGESIDASFPLSA